MEKLKNLNTVIRLSGWLTMIDSITMFAAIIGGLCQDGSFTVSFFIIACVVLAIGVIAGTTVRPKKENLSLRDALFLIAFVWILFSVLGALPFMFGSHSIGFVDALFESVSGYTSTGATIFKDVESLPASILLWRAITQWVGGAGIIMFFLAVVPMLSSGEGVRLFNSEVSGLTSQKFRPRISQTAKGIICTYTGLTILETILLWIGPMTLFDAVTQSLATLSTGGFSTRNLSIESWNSPYIETVVTIFMFLGGVNLQLMYLSAIGHPKRLLKNDTFRYYIGIVVCVSIFVVINRIIATDAPSLIDNIRTSTFQVVSAISSTGFSCINYENWGTDVLFAILIIMFFGACAGSTSSGAKTDRLIFLVKNTRNTFYKTLHPRHLPVVRVNGQIISEKRVGEVIGFLSIYVVIVVICAMIVAAFGLSLQDSMFASISCMSNIGLGYGATGVAGSYASLAAIPKIVFTIEMLVGRLEIFTFLIVFLPWFWRK